MLQPLQIDAPPGENDLLMFSACQPAANPMTQRHNCALSGIVTLYGYLVFLLDCVTLWNAEAILLLGIWLYWLNNLTIQMPA